MTFEELMRKRHSVRQYLNKPIPDDIRNALNAYVKTLNTDGNLNIQILYDEPDHAIRMVFDVLEKEGIETEIIQIGNKPVPSCIACNKCRSETGLCHAFKDDGVNETIEEGKSVMQILGRNMARMLKIREKGLADALEFVAKASLWLCKGFCVTLDKTLLQSFRKRVGGNYGISIMGGTRKGARLQMGGVVAFAQQ